MLKLTKTSVLLASLLLASCDTTQTSEFPSELDMTTWSIVAVDPETGDVGVAVSSCVTVFGDAVAALVPGKGAAATQAGFNIDNRNRVFEAINEGLTAEETSNTLHVVIIQPLDGPLAHRHGLVV